jgi:hypothetical protein
MEVTNTRSKEDTELQNWWTAWCCHVTEYAKEGSWRASPIILHVIGGGCQVAQVPAGAQAGGMEAGSGVEHAGGVL